MPFTQKPSGLLQLSYNPNLINWDGYKYCVDYMGSRFHSVFTCCHACCDSMYKIAHECPVCLERVPEHWGIHPECLRKSYAVYAIIKLSQE